jgi:hypothetical protein
VTDQPAWGVGTTRSGCGSVSNSHSSARSRTPRDETGHSVREQLKCRRPAPDVYRPSGRGHSNCGWLPLAKRASASTSGRRAGRRSRRTTRRLRVRHSKRPPTCCRTSSPSAACRPGGIRPARRLTTCAGPRAGSRRLHPVALRRAGRADELSDAFDEARTAIEFIVAGPSNRQEPGE